MLVVVAGGQDQVAQHLVRRWASHDARLIRPADLSVAGWRLSLPTGAAGTVVVDGEAVDQAAITGALTRLPAVTAADLPQITEADRAYVATEMTAFLLYWLTALPCPVLNRPTPGCLGGPGWWPEQWLALAARIGLPVQPICRNVRFGSADRTEAVARSAVIVTVVGDRCFGAASPTQAQEARRLARAAGVDLLAVSFAGGAANAPVCGADEWPDLTQPEVADAVAALLDIGGRR